MDYELLESSLLYHGTYLLDELRREQQTSIDDDLSHWFRNHLPHTVTPKDDCDQRIVKFVARKADLLFCKPDSLFKLENEDSHNRARFCAALPPMEYFMEVSRNVRRQHFFESLDVGDVVIAVITALLDAGLLLTLLAVEEGMARDIDQLKITAFCPVREIPKGKVHENVLEAFSIKDKVRAVVIAVSDDKITLSLQRRALPSHSTVELGIISDEDLPAYYRSVEMADNRSYGDMLHDAPEFHNPLDVSNMLATFGFKDAVQRPSLMRGLHQVVYDAADYADSLRKRQSHRLAMRSVAAGVDHFKHGRLTEAMQMFNKALQIDADNVDALVARGAIYANSESYRRALEDFDAALAVNPDHANAQKYACDTLLALARSLLEAGDTDAAISRVYRASLMQPNNAETVSLLAEIQRRKELEMKEEDASDNMSDVCRKDSLSKDVKMADISHTSSRHDDWTVDSSRSRNQNRKRHASSSSHSSSTSLSRHRRRRSLPEATWVPAETSKTKLLHLVGSSKFAASRSYDVTRVNPERNRNLSDSTASELFGPALPPSLPSQEAKIHQRWRSGSVSSDTGRQISKSRRRQTSRDVEVSVSTKRTTGRHDKTASIPNSNSGSRRKISRSRDTYSTSRSPRRSSRSQSSASVISSSPELKSKKPLSRTERGSSGQRRSRSSSSRSSSGTKPARKRLKRSSSSVSRSSGSPRSKPDSKDSTGARSRKDQFEAHRSDREGYRRDSYPQFSQRRQRIARDRIHGTLPRKSPSFGRRRKSKSTSRSRSKKHIPVQHANRFSHEGEKLDRESRKNSGHKEPQPVAKSDAAKDVRSDMQGKPLANYSSSDNDEETATPRNKNDVAQKSTTDNKVTDSRKRTSSHRSDTTITVVTDRDKDKTDSGKTKATDDQPKETLEDMELFLKQLKANKQQMMKK